MRVIFSVYYMRITYLKHSYKSVHILVREKNDKWQGIDNNYLIYKNVIKWKNEK